MAIYGPYLAHTWERYGVVIGLYGTYMVANYVKIEPMGSAWDSKLKLTFVWKTYGHIFSIMMDILLDFHSLWIRSGNIAHCMVKLEYRNKSPIDSP